MITPKSMSKRVFGIGIIILGLLVLSIALILGLRFPAYVYNKSVQTQCILEQDHGQYDMWVNDSYRDKTNRIFYWVITNKDDFLYRGRPPKVFQKGPYVYHERETKIDVTFSSNVVSFYFWYRQTFDEARTKAECGSDCNENDELLVINEALLKTLHKFHGDTNLSLLTMPGVVLSTLSSAKLLLDHDERDVLQLFGLIKNNSLDQWRSQLNYPEGYSNLGFGNWIDEQDTYYKTDIRAHRSSNFGVVEIKGLMDALSSEELLGATHTILNNASFPEQCVMPTEESFSSGDSQSQKHSSNLNKDTCRLTSCLFQIGKYISKQPNVQIWGPSLNDSITCVAMYLCTNVTDSCFLFPEDDSLRLVYAHAFHDYILHHLAHYVFHSTVISTHDDLVVSRNQRDLALGFSLKENPFYHDYESNFVPGILEHADSIKDPIWYIVRKKVQLYNCYDTVAAETNFMWKAYDGLEYSPSTLFPNTTNSERRIYSRRRNIPPHEELEACASYPLPQNEYALFHPEVMRTWSYAYDTKHNVRGVGVLKMIVNQSSVISDDFTNEAGLQEMTSWNEYLSWVCLPHFLWANSSLSSLFDMTPSDSQHSSQISFEPITGEAWSGIFRYQQNAGIDDEYLNIRRALSISYKNAPIPVHWVQKSFSYNAVGKNYYKRKFGDLMSISCGGLIGLGTVASLIILTGFLAATIKFKGGRISPLNEEDDNRDHNSVLF